MPTSVGGRGHNYNRRGYAPPPGSLADLSPSGLGSLEALGTPGLVKVTTQSPSGIATANAFGATVVNPVQGPTDLPGWTLDMVDDFTTFNSSVWWKYDGNAQGGHLESDKPANLTLDTTVAGATNGSCMRNQAKIETYNGRAYTAGMMWTKNQNTGAMLYSLPNYFRLEVRAKVTWEQGMWPAPLWFRPTDLAGAYEIDLVESVGKDPDGTMKYTLHTGTSYTNPPSGDHAQVGQTDVMGDPWGWHVFTIEKTPNSIKIYRDGILKRNFTNADSSTAANWPSSFENSARRWLIWSNLQIGSFGGNPDGTTNWANPDSVAQFVDYVYTWVQG